MYIYTHFGSVLAPCCIIPEMKGLPAYEQLCALEQRVESDWPSVQQDLQSLHAVFASRPILNLTADRPAAAHSQLEIFLAGLPAGAASCDWEPRLLRQREGIVVPSMVNFVGAAGRRNGVRQSSVAFKRNQIEAWISWPVRR